MIKEIVLKEILKKMCEYVGADYDKIDFKKKLWFMEYEWSEEQEQEFIDWLTDYLYKNTEPRQHMMAFPMKNKKQCQLAANEFVSNYGWKTK